MTVRVTADNVGDLFVVVRAQRPVPVTVLRCRACRRTERGPVPFSHVCEGRTLSG